MARNLKKHLFSIVFFRTLSLSLSRSGQKTLAHMAIPTKSSSGPKVLAVEGLIGAGKSTLIYDVLLPALSRHYRVQVIREPVDEWVQSGLLQRFYADKRRWGYSFQTKAFSDHIREARRIMTERALQPADQQVDLVIMERSPLSNQIFMATLFSEGSVDTLEYALYHDWCRLCVLPFPITLYLYVRTDLDTCMQRLQVRSREGETGVDRAYQARLLAEHEAEFHRPKLDDGTNCLVVDGAPDYRQDTTLRAQLLHDVMMWLCPDAL